MKTPTHPHSSCEPPPAMRRRRRRRRREEGKKKNLCNFISTFHSSLHLDAAASVIVKMADCIRVTQLMCFVSFVNSIRGDYIGVVKPTANAENLKYTGGFGAEVLKPIDRNLGARASVTRRRSTGWKLAEEAVCRDDVTRLCPRHSWNNNLAVLECLQDKKEVSTPKRVL